MSRSKELGCYGSATASALCLLPDWRSRVLEDFDAEAPDKEWPMKLIDIKSRSVIWNFCECMGVPHLRGIPAQACRLLEIHLCHTFRTKISSLQIDGNEKSEQWLEFQRETFENLPLLMVSCIQLATKYNAGVHIRASKVREVLISIGREHTLQEITATEFNVFRNLGFRVPQWTSLEVAELLSQEAGLSQNNALRNFRALAHIMDIAEFYRKEIEWKVRKVGNVVEEDGTQLRTLHLCAGAVVAMSRIVGSSCDVQRLCEFARAPELLVTCMADLILALIMKPDQDDGLNKLIDLPAATGNSNKEVEH